jgi:hypothetical protein
VPGTLVFSNTLLDPQKNYQYSLSSLSDHSLFTVDELTGDVFLSDVAQANSKRNIVHDLDLIASIDGRIVHEYTVQATVLAFDDQISNLANYVTSESINGQRQTLIFLRTARAL